MRVFLLLFLFLQASSFPVLAADHAVVLMYHHVSTTTPPSTSVAPETFSRHLDYLEEKGFAVLPLSEVLQNLAGDGELPDKTVSITFDDAYRSVLDAAMPLLAEKGWPFTVFVSTRAIERGYRNFLTWDELRELRRRGAEIGNHSHSHAHLVRRLEGETDEQWQDRVREDIVHARKRLHQELGGDSGLFAYPYGEYTPALKQLVGSLGYFGVGQQSGAAGAGQDMLAVPRFPMATAYAGMTRFSQGVTSRPLRFGERVNCGSILREGDTGSCTMIVSLPSGPYRSQALSCFDSAGARLEMAREERGQGSLVSIRLPDWKAGRRKINCTAPSTEGGGYYWYSRQWLVQKPDGSWYKE